MEIILEIVVFLLMAKIGGELAERVNVPSILGELMGGIVLGPSLLKVVSPDPVMTDFSQLGIIFLMFLAGLDTDTRELKEQGVAAFLAAVGGVVVPFVLAFFLGYLYGWGFVDSLFLGATLTATSVGISVRTLMDIGRLHTPVGVTILGAAVIDDVIGILVFTVVSSIGLHTETSVLSFVKLGALIVGFFVITLTMGFWFSDRLSRVMARLKTSEVSLTVSIIFLLIMAVLAEQAKVAGITGAFVAGILMSKSPQKEEVLGKMNILATGFFVPLFFVYIGVQTDIYAVTMVGLAVLVIVVAIVGKIVGCGLTAYATGFSFPDSMRVGIGMIPRMEVALIIASLGLTAGVMSQFVYSLTVAMVLVTTLITPPLLKLAFREGSHTPPRMRRRRRNRAA